VQDSYLITLGLKRTTLKVRIDIPQDQWRNSSLQGAVQGSMEVLGPSGMPSPPIMRHLLDVFMIHFGCQFPFLNRRTVDGLIEQSTGSVFLFNSIASVAAR